VAARRVERALRLTRRPEDAIDLVLVDRAIADAEVVVCATGARSVIVERRVVQAAMDRREGRPLTIVDLSMPRNVAPDVADIDGVDLVRLQDLRGGPGDIQVRRTSDGVLAEHDAYRRWLAGRAVGPVIAALRERVTAICVSEAERQLGSDGAELGRRLAGQLLHAPTLVLKELSASGATEAIDAVAFVLDLIAADERATTLKEAS
jgi:glutamyl-tRNA reductase